MSKLTAERAQERIAHLKQWQEQRGLTLREEEYLEALEGYLPILEQREQSLSDGDWISWDGGRRPAEVKPHTAIEVRFRNNSTVRSTAVHHYEWRHFGKWSDITAYRTIPEGQR